MYTLGKGQQNQFFQSSKQRLKNSDVLDIRYGDVKIKQDSKVTYFGCILDNNLSGGQMACTVLTKIPTHETKVLKLLPAPTAL